MNDQDIAFLKSHGWTVECLSPLEIRNPTSNSLATHEAAHCVLNTLRVEHRQVETVTVPDGWDDPWQLFDLFCSRGTSAVCLLEATEITPRQMAQACADIWSRPHVTHLFLHGTDTEAAFLVGMEPDALTELLTETDPDSDFSAE